MPVDPTTTRRLIESLSTHLEDHLAAWKSSLVDARREIENLLTGISDKIPAHAKPLLPEDLVGIMLEEVLPPPPAEREAELPSPAPAAPTPPDWTLVRGSFAAIESARTQVDVLTRFLTQMNAHASRVALLVLRNDRVTGWRAIGFDASGGRDDGVKTIDLGAEDDAFISEFLRAQRTMLAEPPDEGSPLRRALGGRAPSRTLLVPMVIRDRLAGVVCADELPGEDGRLNEAAIEVLTFVTGLAVDLLAARKKIPSPTLSPTGEPIARYSPGEPQVETKGPIPAAVEFEIDTGGRPASSPPAPGPSRIEPEPTRRRPTDAREALRALEESAARHRRGEVLRPASAIDTGVTSAVPTLTPTAPPRVSGTFPPPLSPVSTGDFTGAFEAIKSSPSLSVASPAVDATAPKPVPVPRSVSSSQVRPIAGFVPRSRSSAPADSPQRAVDDAKRLARLLISEIKLYNERKVEEGRAAGDLYERLKDLIERSRQLYEERTPENIRRETNFFHDELVRILADGRAESLGPMG